MFKRNGLMFVISSPSGAGKSSITKEIIRSDKNVRLSISMTTRKPRSTEIDGIDYNFVSKDFFLENIENNNFYEYAEVFGNMYGTPIKPTIKILEKGQDLIFDVDWQGTQQLVEKCPDVIRIFILPPSIKELQKRLEKRALDSKDVIISRMKKAKNEISHYAEYGWVLVNENLDKTIERVKEIISSERNKRVNQKDLTDFVRNLYREIDK